MTPQTLAGEVSTLFTLPDVVVRARAVMDAPMGSAQALVDVIETDAGLAAMILRLANSVLYGHLGRVDDLGHALAIIGHKNLRDLILATSVVRHFRDIPAEFVDMDTFWNNSITCGALVDLIARRAKLPQEEPLFIAGLLHGIGRLVFYARRPAEYRMAIRYAEGGGQGITAAEQRIFGFTYAQLGAALLTLWGLPERLRVAVEYHLTPDDAPAHRKAVAVVHLASGLAANLAPSLKTPAPATPYTPAQSLFAGHLGLTASDLDDIRGEALAASLEIAEIVQPNATIF